MLFICLKIKSMNKEDIEELKEIVQAAKRLEELIKEIEGPLSDEQSRNLSHEFFCMGAVSVRPIEDIVSRIDNIFAVIRNIKSKRLWKSLLR